jgi:hypothetical protein
MPPRRKLTREPKDLERNRKAREKRQNETLQEKETRCAANRRRFKTHRPFSLPGFLVVAIEIKYTSSTANLHSPCSVPVLLIAATENVFTFLILYGHLTVLLSSPSDGRNGN